jgi:hypothetical protein
MGSGISDHQPGGSILSMRGGAASDVVTVQHAHPAKKSEAQNRMELSGEARKEAENANETKAYAHTCRLNTQANLECSRGSAPREYTAAHLA